MAACIPKTEFKKLYYKDSSNRRHGPFEYKSGKILRKLLQLYDERKLRTYHEIDLYGNESYGRNLKSLHIDLEHILMINYWIPTSVDAIWALKMIKYFNYNVHALNSPYLCCALFLFSIYWYGIQYTGAFIYFDWFAVVCLIIIQWIVLFITHKSCRIILKRYHSKYTTIKLEKPKIISSHIVTLSAWNSGLHNMTTHDIIALLFWKGCNGSLCHICWYILRMFCYLLLPHTLIILLPCYTYCDSVFRWVLPDYYRIQQDIIYLLQPILETVPTDELMHVIYHILNMTVAHFLDNSIGHSSLAHTKPKICSEHGITLAAEIKDEYLQCLRRYLKSKCSIQKTHVCAHHFNHKNVAWTDYKYYQQVNGYNVNEIESDQFWRKWKALICRYPHKNLFPIIPMMTIINIPGLIMIIIGWCTTHKDVAGAIKMILDSEILSVMICFVMLLVLIVILIVVWLKKIYNYFHDFENVTKDIVFWMDPNLLFYLNKWPYDINDSFMNGIINISTLSIHGFLRLIYENEIYFQYFMGHRDMFPDDVTQIILDYVCEYNVIYVQKTKEWLQNQYNAEKTRKEIVHMMTGKINSTVQKQTTCTTYTPSLPVFPMDIINNHGTTTNNYCALQISQ